MPPLSPTSVSLADARTAIRSGDLLLFRGKGLFSAVIKGASRSEYSHAARVVAWGSDLFCCEVREWYGGRAVTLASQVARYPGCIDVYEANADGMFANYDRPAADKFMRRLAGCCYGWRDIFRAAALHTPLVRIFARRLVRIADESNPHRLCCSHACALAERAGGVDSVPNLPAGLTEPGDLARSPFYRYRFTLTEL